MNTIGAATQNNLSQIVSQQVNPSATAWADSSSSADDPDDAAYSAAANGLTGSATGTLSTQTLQALLGLGQNDDAQDTSVTASPGGSNAAQGAHRHHHHHGGPPLSPPTDSTSDTNSATSQDSTASVGETASDASGTDNSLEAALTNL